MVADLWMLLFCTKITNNLLQDMGCSRLQTVSQHGFQKIAVKQINSLNKDPQVYAIRYKEIRCVLIKKFPYMAHFYINDENNTVEVLAVISTDCNPKIWQEKTSKH
jgi:hypothetical protein